MLPFLQDKDGVMAQGSDELKEYGGMDAIAEDMLAAFKKGDLGLLKAALESFREQLKEEDIEQDQQLTER
jgi:hypothetical protein